MLTIKASFLLANLESCSTWCFTTWSPYSIWPDLLTHTYLPNFGRTYVINLINFQPFYLSNIIYSANDIPPCGTSSMITYVPCINTCMPCTNYMFLLFCYLGSLLLVPSFTFPNPWPEILLAPSFIFSWPLALVSPSYRHEIIWAIKLSFSRPLVLL